MCTFMNFFLIWMILDTLWKYYVFLFSFVLPSTSVVPNLKQRCNLRKGMCERGSPSRESMRGTSWLSPTSDCYDVHVSYLICASYIAPPFPLVLRTPTITLCFREHFPNACFCWPHQLRLLSEELKLVSSLDGPSNGKDLEPGGQDLGPNLTPVYMLLSSKHITSLSLSFLIYKMRDTSITCQRFCQLPGTPPRYHGFNSRPLK